MPASYRVRFSCAAEDALREIFNYIRQQSPQTAEEVIERLIRAIDDLEVMPKRFKIVGRSRSGGFDVHARVERPFVIYCGVDEAQEAVFILDVRRGSRRQPRRFD